MGAGEGSLLERIRRLLGEPPRGGAGFHWITAGFLGALLLLTVASVGAPEPVATSGISRGTPTVFHWEASAAWDERFSNDVERRIEHSFERAERRLEAVERQLEDRFEQVEAGLEHFGIEAELRFEEAGRGFQNLETAFERVGASFERVGESFERVGASFERMGARFERLFENFEWRVDGWFGGSAEPLGVPSRITVTRVVPIRIVFQDRR